MDETVKVFSSPVSCTTKVNYQGGNVAVSPTRLLYVLQPSCIVSKAHRDLLSGAHYLVILDSQGQWQLVGNGGLGDLSDP